MVFVRFNDFDSKIRLVGYVNQDVFDARGNIPDEDFPAILADENGVVFQKKL